MIAVKRSWIRSSAASHARRSNRPSPRAPTRRSGVRRRPGPCTSAGYSAGTFAQRTPLVYGFAVDPRTATTLSSSTVTVRLHVSGQSRGQTLARSIRMGGIVPGTGSPYHDVDAGRDPLRRAHAQPHAPPPHAGPVHHRGAGAGAGAGPGGGGARGARGAPGARAAARPRAAHRPGHHLLPTTPPS